ncbi:MAG: flavin reductase [Erysipelotrichaceae bacterium]|nr:flavin reductase [Erysipelotrichaceae bacterium]
MKKIDVKDFVLNPYTKIAKEWMLITAGTSKDSYNTMTASWGHLGSIWGHGGGKPTAVIYIRPQRYTKKFVEENDYFSLSFFDEEYKNDLSYLGSHSGKDEDKVAKTKLTPSFNDKAAYFNEANMVLICKKLYKQDIKEENFIDKSVIEENYPLKDFHTMYIGEIEEIYIKD